jgi:hypothetical protein
MLPPEIKIENIPAGKNLSDMLVAGEIDALLTAQVPAPYVNRANETRSKPFCATAPSKV